ncbi:MAG: peptidoglycan-binding domain-containing protein [Arcanobacterium sp.]|nr:peptidoglycan-binding domain-containing protein [Arcanobacterium sp.]
MMKLRDIYRGRLGWIVAVVAACVAGIATGFVVRPLIVSDHEAAIANSRTSPVVTAVIENKTFTLPRAEISGKASTGTVRELFYGGSDSQGVVTAVLTSPGSTINSGSVIARVSGRPVFVMQLPFDLYRDITSGDSGDDVLALQKELQRLGLYNGTLDGVYGSRTASAVMTLYKNSQSTPPVAAEVTAAHEDGGSDEASSAASKSSEPTASTPSLTPVVAAEFLAIPAAHALVESVLAQGERLNDTTPLAQLRFGEALITARVPVSDIDDFPVDGRVSILASDGTGDPLTSVIRSVSEFKMTDSEDQDSTPGYDITIPVPDGADLSDQLAVRVIGGGDEEQVSSLAVPVTAIREGEGGTYVIGARDNETLRITVARVIDGYALISETDLAGTQVVIAAG